MASPEDQEESVEVDPDTGPIRVVEAVIATYRWDAWKESATAIRRSAGRISTFIGLVAAFLSAGTGLILIPGAGRFSAVVYAPVVGWGIRQWLLGRISERRMRPVLDEVRAVAVPSLVEGVEDGQLLKLLTHGAALLPERSTVIISERRDSAVALVASEYDMSKYAPMFFADAGGGG